VAVLAALVSNAFALGCLSGLPAVLLYREARKRGDSVASSGGRFVTGWVWSWPGYAFERFRLSRESSRRERVSLRRSGRWYGDSPEGVLTLAAILGAGYVAFVAMHGASLRSGLALVSGLLVIVAATVGRGSPLSSMPALMGSAAAVMTGAVFMDAWGVEFVVGPALYTGGVAAATTWWLAAMRAEQTDDIAAGTGR
jgi:hypothetical protein